MIKTAKQCSIYYKLNNALKLKIEALITKTEESILEKECTSYDVLVTSIKQDKEELLPLLKSLDAMFQIQRVLDARASKYFHAAEKPHPIS